MTDKICPLTNTYNTVIINDIPDEDQCILNLTDEQVRLLKWMREMLDRNGITFTVIGEDPIETV